MDVFVVQNDEHSWPKSRVLMDCYDQPYAKLELQNSVTAGAGMTIPVKLGCTDHKIEGQSSTVSTCGLRSAWG